MGGNGDEDEHPPPDYSIVKQDMRLQPIYDIAEICYRKNITEAVICPGSRCAPLALALVRHKGITTRTVSDERSAAFIALGIAQQKRKPTLLVCTSGSAVYNFAPAVAEAFYQQIPLVVFTADRPSDWINQRDGQAIDQKGIYGNHVKKSYHLPEDYDHPDALWGIVRNVNEAINLSRQHPMGPVHINVPLREPLYPEAGEHISFSKDVRIVHQNSLNASLKKEDLARLAESMTSCKKVLLVAGHFDYEATLLQAVSAFSHQLQVPVIGDIVTNLHPFNEAILHADAFLGGCNESIKEKLKPELIVTFGKSVLSKNLKLFLRNYKPEQHWHIEEGATSIVDTFQCLTEIVPSSPTYFLEAIAKQTKSHADRSRFNNLWQNQERKTKRHVNTFFQEEVSEFAGVYRLLSEIPNGTNIHLANSMAVRYANLAGLSADNENVAVFSNRGTSGIDGCSSTAVGHALANENLHVLITGDLAFFYDRNAFWHNYELPNLRVVVLNNHGGSIFGMIDGPGKLPELQEYFITEQKLSAKSVAIEFGFEYEKITEETSHQDLVDTIRQFYQPGGTVKILEIESDFKKSREVFLRFKKQIKEMYEA